eukprot:10589691-Lingulodinium_polyedra.AAC.1
MVHLGVLRGVPRADVVHEPLAVVLQEGGTLRDPPCPQVHNRPQQGVTQHPFCMVPLRPSSLETARNLSS